MIEHIDILCREWAQATFGGLPSISSRSVLSNGTAPGYSDMSDSAWEIEYVVVKMIDPWQAVIYMQYKGPGSMHEKIEKLSLVVPPQRKKHFAGSRNARKDREERYLMGEKRYYALLHQAHVVIERELKANREKIF